MYNVHTVTKTIFRINITSLKLLVHTLSKLPLNKLPSRAALQRQRAGGVWDLLCLRQPSRPHTIPVIVTVGYSTWRWDNIPVAMCRLVRAVWFASDHRFLYLETCIAPPPKAAMQTINYNRHRSVLSMTHKLTIYNSIINYVNIRET